ncbi:CBM_collapsed_G0016630.mRNA.1.CDS.1 [Saccharomyces cerevisiae]|nr:CBM_collapsed_G0016630.mRNA.1.CDS.1 [Saccharomyces cerevisiae]
MVVTFLQDLEVLQDALLNNLQKLSAISRRKESGESKHDNKDSFAAIANEHNDEEEEIEFEDLLVEELDFVLQFVNWFYCYRLKVKEILRQHHKHDLAWNDEKRDRAIKFHAVDYDKLHQGTSSSSSLTSTSMEKASTREKLLSKTKQLTNNLVRGNQILQSGIYKVT